MSGISDRDRDVLLNEIDQIRKALQKTGTSTFADSSSESDEDQAAPIAQGLRDHEKSWRESTLKSWGTTSSNLEDVEDSSEEETSDDNEESSSYYPASRSYVSSSDRWQSYGIDLESSHGENEGNVMLSHAENILSRSNQSSVLTSVPSGIASLRTGAETPLSFPTTPQTPTSFMIDTDDEAYLSESTRSRSVSRAGNSSVSGVGLTPQVAASNLYVEKIFKTQRRKLSGSGQVSLLPGSSSAGSGNPSLGTLECALQLNKQYQEVLRDELKKVERALIKNKEKQEALSSEGQSKTNKVSAFMISHAKFAPTYFKDAFGMGPPDNEDTKERRARTRIEPYETRTKLWTEEERNKLADGVRNQNLEKRLGVWMKKLKNLEKDARYGRKKISEKERRDILQKIEEVRFGLEILVNITDDDRRQESNEIKKMLVHVPETKISKEELEKDVDDLDFFKISKLYLPKRTEFECRLQWLNLDHPRINHAKWTKEEDNQLIKLAEEFQSRHWNKIAEKLGYRIKTLEVQPSSRFEPGGDLIEI